LLTSNYPTFYTLKGKEGGGGKGERKYHILLSAREGKGREETALAQTAAFIQRTAAGEGGEKKGREKKKETTSAALLTSALSTRLTNILSSSALKHGEEGEGGEEGKKRERGRKEENPNALHLLFSLPCCA